MRRNVAARVTLIRMDHSVGGVMRFPTFQRAGVSGARQFLFSTLACAAVAVAAVPAPAFAQAGLEAAVRSAVRGDREVAQFYQQRGYRPLWVRGNALGPEAQQLLHLI